jgi:hypothetical protein
MKQLLEIPNRSVNIVLAELRKAAAIKSEFVRFAFLRTDFDSQFAIEVLWNVLL